MGLFLVVLRCKDNKGRKRRKERWGWKTKAAEAAKQNKKKKKKRKSDTRSQTRFSSSPNSLGIPPFGLKINKSVWSPMTEYDWSYRHTSKLKLLKKKKKKKKRISWVQQHWEQKKAKKAKKAKEAMNERWKEKYQKGWIMIMKNTHTNMWMVLECFRCWFIHHHYQNLRDEHVLLLPSWDCDPHLLFLNSNESKGEKIWEERGHHWDQKKENVPWFLWFQNYFMGMIENDVLFRERGKYWKRLEEGRKQTSSKS